MVSASSRPDAPGLGEQRAQVLAVHVLHRQEVDAGLLADLEHLRDVVVVERGGQPGLVEEHLHRGRILCALGRDHLEHDVALEAANAGRARHVDPRHASGRQRRQDLVLAEVGG
jgi:hypothetical protein